MKVVLTQTQRDVIAAYIWDRAEQYSEESGMRSAFYYLAKNIREGESEMAFAHGELDDIMTRFGYPAPKEAS